MKLIELGTVSEYGDQPVAIIEATPGELRELAPLLYEQVYLRPADPDRGVLAFIPTAEAARRDSGLRAETAEGTVVRLTAAAMLHAVAREMDAAGEFSEEDAIDLLTERAAELERCEGPAYDVFVERFDATAGAMGFDTTVLPGAEGDRPAFGTFAWSTADASTPEPT